MNSKIIAFALFAAVIGGNINAYAADNNNPRPMYAWEKAIKESPVLDYSYNTWDGLPYYSETFEKSFENSQTEYANR